MSLRDLLERATPRPWVEAGSNVPILTVANMRLAALAVNHIEELVGLLREARHALQGQVIVISLTFIVYDCAEVIR